MADLQVIGNCVVITLCAGSLLVWGVVFRRAWRGKPPLQLCPQEPVSWPALPVCATFMVSFFAPVFIYALASSIEPLSLAAVRFQVLEKSVQIVVVVGLLACAGPLRGADFGWNPARWLGDARVGAAGFLASLVPVFVLLKTAESLGWRREGDEHSLLKILEAHPGIEAFSLIALASVVLAPLAEELIYRVLLQGWTESQIAPGKAILFSSFIFCLVHQLPDIIPLAPLALILGYVYHRRHSYAAVVVMHALFNALTLALTLLMHS